MYPAQPDGSTSTDSPMTQPAGDAALSLRHGNQNAIRLSESYNKAAAAVALIREMFPIQGHLQESDVAARLRVDLMAEILIVVGEEKFMEGVRRAISLSKSRYDCSIRKIRDCCGLSDPLNAAAKAWTLVVFVFEHHCRIDHNGNYRLEDAIINRGGLIQRMPAPEIPPAAMAAVRALGGWAALDDRSLWGIKYRDFCSLYTDPDLPVEKSVP